MSLVYMHKRKWPASILCAAIASVQNQPLIFLVAFLWIKGMVCSKKRLNDFFVFSLAAVPVITPNIFYYTKFGVHSLLAETTTHFTNISMFRIYEMFFDLNIGMLHYIPITLFVFFWIDVPPQSSGHAIPVSLVSFFTYLHLG